ncbi:MAG: hypothetical protein QM520_07115 [Gammaproteobacteria bacterium]|nr:hypothetical protein [Gammaproteobacteria bacterium]
MVAEMMWFYGSRLPFAPTTQGIYTTTGGAQQILVPNAVDEDTKRNVNNTVLGVTTMAVGVASGGTASLALRGGGALLGGGINAWAQAALNSDQKIDWIDVALGSLTGALTMNGGITNVLLTNTGGSILGAGIKGENATNGAASTAAGSVIGFGLGAATASVIKVLKPVPWYQTDTYVTNTFGALIAPIPEASAPAIGGTIVGNGVQETSADKLKKYLEGLKK